MQAAQQPPAELGAHRCPIGFRHRLGEENAIPLAAVLRSRQRVHGSCRRHQKLVKTESRGSSSGDERLIEGRAFFASSSQHERDYVVVGASFSRLNSGEHEHTLGQHCLGILPHRGEPGQAGTLRKRERP
jgi:hypothetical protein